MLGIFTCVVLPHLVLRFAVADHSKDHSNQHIKSYSVLTPNHDIEKWREKAGRSYPAFDKVQQWNRDTRVGIG